MRRRVRAEIEAAVAGRTVCSSFLETVARQPDDVALRWADGEAWATWSWSEYADRVARAASGLRRLGVAPGDRVALLIRNRPEFHLLDLGALFAGATPFSIYNSSSSEQIAYLLSHSTATVVVAETAEMLARVQRVRNTLPDLAAVVAFPEAAGDTDGVIPVGTVFDQASLDLGVAAGGVQAQDLATIVYTSGTTGASKGVMLTHHNVVSGIETYTRLLKGSLRGMRKLSYLPMAHIAERVFTHYSHVAHGSVVTTCPDLSQLSRYMVEVRPELWFCAPRLWEKLRAGIEALLVADPELGARFQEALATGVSVESTIRPLLARIGLDDVKIALTGAAPLPRATHEFFLTCGLPLSDGYGQSEATGFISWDPEDIVPGTSGKPLPGVEVKLAEDDEILVRGPNVFAGYLNDPVRTREALDEEGWLHTGDVGRFDPGGNLIVTDRKNEIIVPSSGHNVSPTALEAALKESPLIGQACVVGDGRPFIAALLVLDPEMAPPWARQRGLDPNGLASSAELIEEIQRHVEAINTRVARPEQVRAFRIVHDEWLPDSDVLTPTAKLKRREVHRRYAALLEEMYA